MSDIIPEIIEPSDADFWASPESVQIYIRSLEAIIENSHIGEYDMIGYQYCFTDPMSGLDVWRDSYHSYNGQEPKASREIFAKRVRQ